MMRTSTWRALGTGVVLVTNGTGHTRARSALAALLEKVDATYSRFRPDSELSRLNAWGGQRVPVSPLLADAIGASLRGARLTDGLVDPTVGRAMRLIGYDVDFATVASRSDGRGLRFEPVPGWQAVHFDADAPWVQLDPGVELDLGSTGKALAAELGTAAARAAMGGGGALVSLGGDVAVAGEPPTGGWRILAAEDSTTPPDAPGEVITLTSGGTATSSTTVRRWTRDGVRLHHLVDPATGRPASGPWRTVTVAAASCVDANIAATAAVLLGDRAVGWLEERCLPARLVGTDGAVRWTAGWPIPEMQAVPA